MTNVTPPIIVADTHCECGENPIWDERSNRLLWLDIPPGRLFAYSPETDATEVLYEDGAPIGGFTLQEDGSFLFFQSSFVSIWKPGEEKRVLLEDIDSGMARFNDALADPEGRVFVGTIGKTEESGGLYRIDLDGKVTRLFRGTRIANGMGFSPDLRFLYWTCSTSKRVFRFPYDRTTGELGDRDVLFEVPKGPEIPDGLTVDNRGNVWSARWDGGCVRTYTPDGEETGRIPLPTPQVTSLCFGGPELEDIYITTAGGSEESKGPEGALFRLKGPVRGRPEFRSRIRAVGG